MSGIRGSNTKPERTVRSLLHGAGFRFRLQARHLPGRPDLVLPKHRAVVFVHGCFWHGHNCHLFKIPSTRPEFWTGKIEGNRARDAVVADRLREAGWRRLVIWECAMKGKRRLLPEDLQDRASRWLRGTDEEGEIAGDEIR